MVSIEHSLFVFAWAFDSCLTLWILRLAFSIDVVVTLKTKTKLIFARSHAMMCHRQIATEIANVFSAHFPSYPLHLRLFHFWPWLMAMNAHRTKDKSRIQSNFLISLHRHSCWYRIRFQDYRAFFSLFIYFLTYIIK